MPGYGPASTPDVAGIGAARMRVLRALQGAADQGEATTVGSLAALLDAHPNGVRRHLADLVQQGLAATVGAASEGRGRPSVAYQATALGRSAVAAAGAPISAEYLGMAAAFARHLTARSATPASEAREIGRHWGTTLAEGPPAPASDAAASGAAASDAAASGAAGGTPSAADPPRRRVLRLLEGLGFSPLHRPDGSVALRTCPLLDAARANPEVLCEVHLGMVQGASAAFGGPGDGGELLPFAESGACVLRLPDVRAAG